MAPGPTTRLLGSPIARAAAGVVGLAVTTWGTWELPKPTGFILAEGQTHHLRPRSPWPAASSRIRQTKTARVQVGEW